MIIYIKLKIITIIIIIIINILYLILINWLLELGCYKIYLPLGFSLSEFNKVSNIYLIIELMVKLYFFFYTEQFSLF